MYHFVKDLYPQWSFVTVKQKWHPRWPPKFHTFSCFFNIISGVEDEYATNEHN